MANEKSDKNMYEEAQLSDVHKKVVSIICIVIFIAISLFVAYFIGMPLMQNIKEPEKFREWVNGFGAFGWLMCIGLMVLQIIVAIIPGGAIEIGAGYAFGAFGGTILCMIGSVIGSVLVFQFVRVLGVKVVEALFPLEKIRSLKFLHDEKKRNILALIVFAIPGTPKDLLSYFMGLTEMKLSTWLIISTIARTPAVVISAMSGDALGEQQYYVAVIIGIVLLVGSVAGAVYYRRMSREKK